MERGAMLLLGITALSLFVVGLGTFAMFGSTAGIADLGWLVLVLAFIAAIVVWILGLVATTRTQRYGWFIVVLLLGPFGALSYAFAGPRDQVPRQPGDKSATSPTRIDDNHGSDVTM